MRTTLFEQPPSGWVVITHPFHPLRGQRFELLKEKRHAEGQILMLRGTSRGTFGVPLDWTDRAPPSQTDLLEWRSLVQLADLLERLQEVAQGS